MKYSIVIPVFMRSEIIYKCLKAIEKQILKPLEVILVDNNTEEYESEKLRVLKEEFIKKNVLKILLIKSPKNSGAVARNIGAKKAKGEIVAFLDSDVIIDNNYYSILLKYFEKYKGLIAIQGTDRALIESQRKLKNGNFLSKTIYAMEQFFETSLLLNRKGAFVSPSLAVSHPPVDKEFEIQSQWISTCAGLFKKELFNKYSFPKQFITYSNNEYLMFSYNLFIDNMGLMIYTNKAKYRDLQTNIGRISPIALMYQIEAYDLYIFLKFFKINPQNIYIFIKSRIGHLIYNVAKLVYRKDFLIINYFHAVFSIFYPLINLKSIRKGDLYFYEQDFYKK